MTAVTEKNRPLNNNCHPDEVEISRREVSRGRIYAFSRLIAMSLKPAFAQVLPLRIQGDNQCHFLQPNQSLYMLFPGNCRGNIAEAFEVNETINLVPGRKPGCQAMFVLENALFQISGHTCVQCFRPVRENVDVIKARGMHGFFADAQNDSSDSGKDVMVELRL
jgi:hypothetical protein